MADRTYKEWVEEYERICARQPKIVDLIASDPSPEALRLGVDHLLRLFSCEVAMHGFEHQWLQARIAQIEDILGLSPRPPVSDGRARPKRRVHRKA